MTVAVAFVTVNVCETSIAAVQLSLPLCDAVTATVPAPVKVSVVPLSVAGPVTEYVTASPLLAVAFSDTVAVVIWSEMAANVMV